MISIFNVVRFISVFSILFEMENAERVVCVQETGKNNQETGQLNLELNVQSPSETMLERLKEIRKWQEKHREKLAEVQSFSFASPTLNSRDNQTAVPTVKSDFSFQAPKGSVCFHPENKIENKSGMSNVALTKSQELETVSPSGTVHETHTQVTHLEREAGLSRCNVKHLFAQDAINFCKSTTCCVPLRSPESSLNEDTLEDCETKSVEEYREQVDSRSLNNNITNNNNIIPVSKVNIVLSNNERTKTHVFIEQNESAHCDNSEQILEEKDSVVYNSEKYKSNAEQKFSFIKSISEKNLSKFLPPARNLVANIAGECDNKPKPKRRYLRKGEGTARFGMKPMQLNKSNASVNPNHSDMGNKVKKQELRGINNHESTNVKTSIMDNSTLGNNIRKIDRRPINNLQLKKLPFTTVNKFQNEVDSIACTASSNEKWQKFEQECERAQLCPETHPNPSVSNVGLYNQSLKEKEELSAFEKLEELAADSSFSSNSSTVLQLLQRGLHSMASTPLHARPPLPSRERLNCSDGDMAPKKCLFEPNTANLNLLDRLLKSKDTEEFSAHIQQTEFNVSQILEQLRAIIELEEHDVSEAEIQSFFESFGDASISRGAASRFACSVSRTTTNATSTPALTQDIFLPKPHVHFRNEGVEVLEYELTETDEDTLTDAPTLTEDDSDLATTSDMEALAHLNLHEPLIRHSKMAGKIENEEMEECSTDDEACKSSASNKLTTNDPRQETGLPPLVLHFSPPQQKHNSASNYIWSIFGKDRDSKTHSDQKKVSNNSKPVHSSYRNEMVHKQAQKVTAAPKVQEKQGSATDEIETCKTLLLAKVCELEKETKIFKRETSKLQKLQELAIDEKKQLTEERDKLHEEITKEKNKFREYIDNERNAVWKEKRGLKHLSPSIIMANQNSLEIVYLKEQIQDLQDKAKKRETLHQYAVKKLNEKIKTLEVENKELKEKILNFQSLGKENLQLKHELDRAKLNGKRVVVNQAANSARENPRPKAKVATVNSVNISLDKLARIEGKGIGTSNEKREPSTLNTQDGTGGKDTGNHETNLAPLSPLVDGQIHFNLDEAHQQHTHTRQDNLSTASLQKAQNISVPFDDKNSEFTESFRDDGTKEIVYANGNKKEIYSNGLVVVSYYNGDRKEIHEDRTIYIYGTDHTSHTTFNDGKEVLVFPSGQKETRLPDGSSEIIFTDNSRKIIHQDGVEICIMKDGIVVRSNPDGSKVFEFVNGQREIHTVSEKRREYPDGTVKIVHRDGRTETRYKTGRTRIRDSQGNIILDSHHGLS